MIWRPANLSLRRLRLAGDHVARQGKRHVRDLAESLTRDSCGRNLARVIVRGETMEVLAGHDRCAAAAVAGLNMVACEVVSGLTDAQAAAITHAENAYRRHDERERQAAINDIIAGSLPVPEEAQPRRPGRPKSAASRAIAARAAEIGTSPRALAQAAERAEARERAKTLEEIDEETDEEPVEHLEIGGPAPGPIVYDPSMDGPQDEAPPPPAKPAEDPRDRARRQVLLGVRTAGRLWVAQLAAAGLTADAAAVGRSVDAIEQRLTVTSPRVQDLVPEPEDAEEPEESPEVVEKSPEVVEKSPPVAAREIRVVLTCERCGAEYAAADADWHFCEAS